MRRGGHNRSFDCSCLLVSLEYANPSYGITLVISLTSTHCGPLHMYAVCLFTVTFLAWHLPQSGSNSGDQRSKHPRKSCWNWLHSHLFVYFGVQINSGSRTTTLKVYLQIISISNYLTLIEPSTHKYNIQSYIIVLKWYNDRTLHFVTLFLSTDNWLQRQCKVSQQLFVSCNFSFYQLRNSS